MPREELSAVLDFILNRADESEFEVVRKACERRLKDGGAFAALGASSPTVMAKDMAGRVQELMGATMGGMRETVRGFVETMIRQQESEMDEEEVQRLLDQLLPPEGAERRAEAPSPLAPEALLAMTRDFVSYSEGTMPPSRQKELWDWMPRWQDRYWEALPSEIKAIVKAYIDGRLTAETFTTALLSILKI